MDNIPKSELSDKSRVAFLRSCTDIFTDYVVTLQVGLTNGIGSQIKWMTPIGRDESNELNDCATYELEKEDYHVDTIEIGYTNLGKLEE